MIIIFPLMPIVIAVFLLAAALLNKTADSIQTIITVAWVIVIAVSVLLILCNLFRKTSLGNKILGSILSVAATVITLIESENFLFGLAASSDTSSIMGTVEFGFVLIFGGSIWLLSTGLCTYAGFACFDPDEFNDTRYFKAIFSLVGSLALGGFFGLLG